MALGIPCWNQGIPVEILESGFKISNSGIGVRPICQRNFGNNRMLKEPRIMLE